MKTTSSVSRKMTTAITGLTLLVITALTFTSCKKEEIQQPGSAQSSNVSEKQMNLVPPPPLVFKSIKFDHYAGGTRRHDYSLTINANGTGLYVGRLNVRVKGERTLKISGSDLNKINNLCIQFIEISKGGFSEQIGEKLVAIPTVITTYLGANKSSNRILLDHDNGQPVWLVMFRTQVEQVLKISNLTDAAANSQVATVEN